MGRSPESDRRLALQRGTSSRRGQALIEGALTILVFLALLLGILDIGQVLFIHQTLTERARNAARYGVVRVYDASAIRNVVLYDQPTIPQGKTSGIFGLTSSMVSVQRFNEGTTDDRLIVTVSNYPFQFFNPFVAGVYRGKPITASLPYERP